VDILGNLKVTGEIDPTKVIIQPSPTTDNSLVINNAGGNDVLVVGQSGGLTVKPVIDPSVISRVFTVAKNTGATVSDLLYVSAGASDLVGVSNADRFFAKAKNINLEAIPSSGNGEIKISQGANSNEKAFIDMKDGGGNVTLHGEGEVTVSSADSTFGLLNLQGGWSKITVGNAGIALTPKAGATVDIAGGNVDTGVTVFDNDGSLAMAGGLFVASGEAVFGEGNREADTVLIKNTKWFKLEKRSEIINDGELCDNEGVIVYAKDTSNNGNFFGCRKESGSELRWKQLNNS